MARLAIDPVTRVGGHLRVEADVAGGQVREAWSSGTMFRGIELVLRGRDPRDAWMFAERICGTCTGVHALASVRAVEQALGVTVPTNARLVRNILAVTQAIRDHVVGFYLSQLPDWVDAKAALTADPAATSRLARSLSNWPQASPEYFGGVRDRLAATIEGGQAGPWANGYWGHPAYRLSPEQDLLLLAHGLEALDWQRRLMRIHVLMGGRDPHPQTYLVGGMSLVPDWGGPIGPGTHPPVPDRNAPSALSDAGLSIAEDLLVGARTFVDQVFAPDVMELARAYPDWATLGAGIGRYLSYGQFPEDASDDPVQFLPAGRVSAPELAVVDTVNEGAIGESTAHAWYEDPTGPETMRRPVEGETRPAFSGGLPITTFEGANHYSWIKAARYNGIAMEVGPLARMLVAYAQGHTDSTTALTTALTDLGMTPDGLTSTLGRIVARAVETQVLARRAGSWLGELRTNLATGDLSVADLTRWAPGSWLQPAEGWSLGEGPRGSVGHWVRIEDGVIRRYQVVDGTTWNASPRDASGNPGPMEAALVGTPVSDPSQPLEILRTVHAFSPCAACAVHALGRREGALGVHVRDTEARR
jgi:Ni,Fe-hydrogenase I large subunit